MSLMHRWWLATRSVPKIRGGLALPRNKPGLPAAASITTLAMPGQLVLPLLNYQRERLTPQVSVGDTVQLGDTLAEGVVASADGRITAIEQRPIIHPSGRDERCIVIETDPSVRHGTAVHPSLEKLTVERLDRCAVRGLGGAGFATATKLRAGSADAIDTLLINAVECEPTISCDEALIMCHAVEIIEAVECLIELTGCRRCVLAIENDKHSAINALNAALSSAMRTAAIELQQLAPVYPSGAERPLIAQLTGRVLPADVRPIERGILCLNVATALAAGQARQGQPQTTRIVTVAGEAASHPVNVRVTFGTSVVDVLRYTGNGDAVDKHRVRAGGPLSGFDLLCLDVPVTATTNCITIEPDRDRAAARACIRCGNCSDVCPADLLPQQLFWHAKADDLPGAQRLGLDACIECGCCDVVCPSQIPLTQTFRYARDVAREQQRQVEQARFAEQHHRSRELRLEQRKSAHEEKRREAESRLAGNNDPIAAALARARRRRRKPGTGNGQS